MSKSKHTILLEASIERAVRNLGDHEPGSEEYGKTLDHVVKLHKLLEEDKSTTVSKDMMVAAGTNLLGIVMILGSEWIAPITSKALGFVVRPRM